MKVSCFRVSANLNPMKYCWIRGWGRWWEAVRKKMQLNVLNVCTKDSFFCSTACMNTEHLFQNMWCAMILHSHFCETVILKERQGQMIYINYVFCVCWFAPMNVRFQMKSLCQTLKMEPRKSRKEKPWCMISLLIGTVGKKYFLWSTAYYKSHTKLASSTRTWKCL